MSESDDTPALGRINTDDYVENRRIESILNLRENAAEKIRNYEGMRRETRDPLLIDESIKSTVSSYALEAREIITDVDNELWTTQHIGTVDIPRHAPAAAPSRSWQTNSKTDVDVVSIAPLDYAGEIAGPPDMAAGLVIHGLGEFVRLDTPLTVAYRVDTQRRLASDRIETRYRDITVSKAVSLAAFEMINDALRGAGVKLSVGEKEHRTVIILDRLAKISQWRADND